MRRLSGELSQPITPLQSTDTGNKVNSGIDDGVELSLEEQREILVSIGNGDALGDNSYNPFPEYLIEKAIPRNDI